MTPIFQNRFPDRNGRGSDAFRACLASVLDLGMRDVPALDEKTQGDAVSLLNDFLMAQGLVLEDCGMSAPKQWSIVTGSAPGFGHPHACVAFDGVIVHDPHPRGRRQLSQIHNYWTLLHLDGIAMQNDPAGRHPKTHP